MRWFFIIPALCTINAAAQYKKVPDFNNQRQFVNKQILKSHYKGFRVITLSPFPDGLCDTTEVSDYQYYPSGLIKKARHYDYAQWDDIKDFSFRGALSKLKEGESTDYTYDARGNVLSKKECVLLPANSYLALMAAAMNDENAPVFNPDSFLSAGIPEAERIQEEVHYSYNKDGNAISSENVTQNTATRYTYVYNKNKQVAVQRLYETMGGFHDISSLTEYHFGYNNHGDLDSLVGYKCGHDTADILLDRCRTFSSYRTYNNAGKLIKERYQIIDGRYDNTKTKEYTYTDSLLTRSITYNGRNDTDEKIDYLYNSNGKLAEKCRFSSGGYGSTTTEKYSYDSAGNISLVIYAARDAASGTETVRKKELFYLYK